MHHFGKLLQNRKGETTESIALNEKLSAKSKGFLIH